MRAGDADIDAADHDIALFLGIDEGVVDAFAGGLEIDDLAFADAAGGGLADAENFHGAVRLRFADDDTHLGGADFQPYENVILAHLCLNVF